MNTAIVTTKKSNAKKPAPRNQSRIGKESWVGSLKYLRIKPGVDLTKPTLPVYP